MENNFCGECKHFVRHYIKMGRKYVTIDLGHCIKKKSKKQENIQQKLINTLQ